MFGFAKHWLGFGNAAYWIYQFCERKQFSALVALVCTCLFGFAKRASTFDISVCKKKFCLLVIRLLGFFLNNMAVFVELEENVLRDFGMNRAGRPSKIIKLYAEPFVDIFVNFIVFVAYLTRTYSFLERFYLGCGSVFVSSANKKRFFSAR